MVHRSMFPSPFTLGTIPGVSCFNTFNTKFLQGSTIQPRQNQENICILSTVQLSGSNPLQSSTKPGGKQLPASASGVAATASFTSILDRGSTCNTHHCAGEDGELIMVDDDLLVIHCLFNGDLMGIQRVYQGKVGT